MVDFEWNKAVKWPKLFIFDGRTFPFLLLAAFASWFIYVWLLLVILFIFAGINGVPISMYLRKVKMKILGKKMDGYPIHKQHGLKYSIGVLLFSSIAAGSIYSEKSYASFEVVDSLHYGIDWRMGEPGTTTNDFVEGFANDIPLELALQQIVPQDWVLLFTDDVRKNELVSWHGGMPWAKVLKQLADNNSLNFEIHTTTNRILIEKDKGSLGSVTFKTGVNDSKKFTMESKVWRLERGQYLSQALRDWAQSVGWDVEWSLDKDFIVEQPIQYSGSLINAVKDLIKSYRNQRVMLRVQATEHYSNHVIHIHQTNE